jgi:chromosome segregation ATPase
MQSGRKTLASLDNGLKQIHRQVQDVDEQIDRVSGGLLDLQQAQAERFRRMAEIRLDSMVSGELGANLDAAGRRVRELLQERVSELESLTESIEDNRNTQLALEAKRELAAENTRQPAEALARGEAATQARLEQNEDYRAQLAKAERAERMAVQAEEKRAQAESVRVEKGQPYEQDVLFHYLWERGYGTSRYTANALVRYLDDRVAGLCNYEDARRNYARLLEIPQRLGEHASRVAADADEEFAKLKALEEIAAAEDGLPAFRDALASTQAELDRVDADIDAAETQLHELEERRARFASGDDTLFRRAIDTLSSAFQREDLLTLYDYARATATAEDDLLVREMEADNQQIRQTGESLAEHKRVRERHYSRLQELEGVRRRFKQQRFDSAHSGFRNEAMVAMILSQFLQGTVTAQELWRTLEREQRYRRIEANPDFGTGGFRPRPGTWNVPFPRGGGLGGGAGGRMRIPRGMPRGGGGGFRTGGGF